MRKGGVVLVMLGTQCGRQKVRREILIACHLAGNNSSMESATNRSQFLSHFGRKRTTVSHEQVLDTST